MADLFFVAAAPMFRAVFALVSMFLELINWWFVKLQLNCEGRHITPSVGRRWFTSRSSQSPLMAAVESLVIQRRTLQSSGKLSMCWELSV